MCSFPDPDPDPNPNTEALPVKDADVCPVCHGDSSHPDGYCHVRITDGYRIAANTDLDEPAVDNSWSDEYDPADGDHPDGNGGTYVRSTTFIVWANHVSTD